MLRNGKKETKMGKERKRDKKKGVEAQTVLEWHKISD